jgi:hypothetical protein
MGKFEANLVKKIHIALALILVAVPVMAAGCSAGDCEYPDVDLHLRMTSLKPMA